MSGIPIEDTMDATTGTPLAGAAAKEEGEVNPPDHDKPGAGAGMAFPLHGLEDEGLASNMSDCSDSGAAEVPAAAHNTEDSLQEGGSSEAASMASVQGSPEAATMASSQGSQAPQELSRQTSKYSIKDMPQLLQFYSAASVVGESTPAEDVAQAALVEDFSETVGDSPTLDD
jgi:recombinational DNA repair protein (RecF pathway)